MCSSIWDPRQGPSLGLEPTIKIYAHNQQGCKDDNPSFAYHVYRPDRCNIMANSSSYMLSCQPSGLLSYSTFSDSNCENLMSNQSTMGVGSCTSENIADLPGSSFEYLCPIPLWILYNVTYNSSSCETNAVSVTSTSAIRSPNCSESVCSRGDISFATNTCSNPGVGNSVGVQAYPNPSCFGRFFVPFQLFSPGVCVPVPNSPLSYFRATCSGNFSFATFESFNDSSCTVRTETKTVPAKNECSLINASAGLQGLSFSYGCFIGRVWKRTTWWTSLNCSDPSPVIGYSSSIYGYQTDQVYDGNGASCVESPCEVVSLQGVNVSRTVRCTGYMYPANWPLAVAVISFPGPRLELEDVSAYTFQNGRCNLNAGTGSYKVGCFMDGTFYYNTYLDSACAILNSSRTAASYKYTHESVGLPGFQFLYYCDVSIIANETMTTVPASTSTVAPTSTTTNAPTSISAMPASTTTTTTPPPAIVVVIVVFSDSVQAGLSSSLISILSSLTGLPSSAFQVVIVSNSKRAGSTASVTITNPDASEASSVIVSTLSSNPAYLTQQNSAFPSISSARVSSSASCLSSTLFVFVLMIALLSI